MPTAPFQLYPLQQEHGFAVNDPASGQLLGGVIDRELKNFDLFAFGFDATAKGNPIRW